MAGVGWQARGGLEAGVASSRSHPSAKDASYSLSSLFAVAFLSPKLQQCPYLHFPGSGARKVKQQRLAGGYVRYPKG